MTRAQKTSALVARDIGLLKDQLAEGVTEFAETILVGGEGMGFTPYSQLSDEMLDAEHDEMLATTKHDTAT